MAHTLHIISDCCCTQLVTNVGGGGSQSHQFNRQFINPSRHLRFALAVNTHSSPRDGLGIIKYGRFYTHGDDDATTTRNQ